MDQNTIDAIVDLVTDGTASVPVGDLTTRTFTKAGKSVTLAIAANAIIASNNGTTIGSIPDTHLEHRFLHIEIKTVRDATGELNDLLTANSQIVLSKVDFMQLFKLPELTDIEDLQKGDPDASTPIEIDKTVRTAMTLLDETEHVDLGKPVVQAFVSYLATLSSPNRSSGKILTAARVAQILSGQPPASAI